MRQRRLTLGRRTLMAHLPRCDPLLDARVRDAFAAIEGGERRHDARDLPFVAVQVRGDRFGREERTGAPRGSRHFFEAFLERVSNAHGDGCGTRGIHNVYIVSRVAQRAMKSRVQVAGVGHGTWRGVQRKSKNSRGGVCTEIGGAAHADWMPDNSWISSGERWAGRGVERSIGVGCGGLRGALGHDGGIAEMWLARAAIGEGRIKLSDIEQTAPLTAFILTRWPQADRIWKWGLLCRTGTASTTVRFARRPQTQ